MDAIELRNIRDNLVHIRAWLQHWREDAECRLTPTPASLDSAMFRVTNSLGALDRIESEQKEAA